MPAAKTKTKSAQKQDAIALLKADHRAVEELFEQFEGATRAASKQKLAQQICQELIIHTIIEEEIFYPGVKDAVEDDMMDEAYVEHDGAKMLITEIMAGSPDDPFYDAKVKVLSEEIKHHVKEEEQRDGMFAQAKKSDVDLAALGEEMAARKAELMKEFKANGPSKPVTKSMKGAMPEVGRVVQV